MVCSDELVYQTWVHWIVVVFFLDDEDKIREELKDLIDDAPIDDEESDADSDASGRNAKRKKSDDDDDELDDRLEDEDYELIEENLGVKVERVSAAFLMIKDLYRRESSFRNASNVSSASLTKSLTTRNATKISTARSSPINCS